MPSATRACSKADQLARHPTGSDTWGAWRTIPDMTTQTPPAPAPATSGEPTPIEEVDLVPGLRAIGRKWWVVAGATALGALAGMGLAGGSTESWESSAIVYVGQPITMSGSPMNTVTSKAATALEIARGDDATSAAATASGASAQRIRGGLVVVAVQTPLASKLPNPPAMLKVSVRDRSRAVSQRAATAIANHVVDSTNTYAPDKVKDLESQVRDFRQSISELQAQQRSLLGNGTSETRAILASLAGRDLAAARAELSQAQSALGLAREVELSRVVTQPRAVRITTTARHSTVAMGALLGMLIGLLAAWALGRRPTA